MTRVFARLVLLPKNVSSVLSPRDKKALTCVLTAAFFGSSSRKNPNQNHVWRRKEQGQKGVAGPKGGNDTRKLGAPPVPRVYQEHDSGRRSGVQVPLLSGTLPKRGRISEGEKKPRKTKEEQEGQEEQERTKEARATPGGPARNTELTGSRWRSGTPRHFFAMVLFHGGEIFCFEVKCFDVFVSVGGVTYCGGHVI